MEQTNKLLPVLARLADWQVERGWSEMDGMRNVATAAAGLIKEREYGSIN